MKIESAIVDDLSASGYHPRSQTHSDLQSYAIVADLLSHCDLLRGRAERGEVVAKLRHHQQVGHDDWVIDIAIGTAAGTPVPVDSSSGSSIHFQPPALIQIAIELKSIYTEHLKARKNRLRDFNAFHGYAHQYNPKTVAAAFLLVNAAEHFYSPLRPPDDITRHGGRRGVKALVDKTISIFRTINLRNGPSDPPGLEAIGVVAFEHDNFCRHPRPDVYKDKCKPTRLLIEAPAPRVGDPLHYSTMIQRICQQFTERFRT
ncbi:MAG: hypothetical protein ACT4P4_22450 [Betaproteobacteria bacterium]